MRKRVQVLAVLVALVALVGCKEQPKIVVALGVVGNVFTLAQDDLPSLQVAGVLTAADVKAFGNWLTAGQTLLAQGQTCVNGLGASGSASALAACVNAFATGLLSPAEQANLRIISPGAQKKVTLYVTAIVLATNFAAQIVNAVQSQTPPVGSTAAAENQPSREDIHELAVRLRLSPTYGY